jgi:hypothetical protein
LESIDNTESTKPKVASILICVFSVSFFIFGEFKVDSLAWQYSQKPYATEHIVALNDSNMISGKLYLRSGYINEDLYYQYLVKLSSGGFITNKVHASNATLFYDDSNYRVEWYTKKKSWLYFQREEKYVKIYIPRGSVTNDFSVDLN